MSAARADRTTLQIPATGADCAKPRAPFGDALSSDARLTTNVPVSLGCWRGRSLECSVSLISRYRLETELARGGNRPWWPGWAGYRAGPFIKINGQSLLGHTHGGKRVLHESRIFEYDLRFLAGVSGHTDESHSEPCD